MADRNSESRNEGEGQPSGERLRAIVRENGAEAYKGLCANCASRATCLLPKTEGGVWHCEEYLEED